MGSSLLAKKPMSLMLEESRDTSENSLKRTLGPVSLTALGIGAIIGAGIFVLSGLGAHYAGPGLMLSFVAYGLLFARVVAMPHLLRRKSSDLFDAEDDEFRRADDRDADQADQPAILDVIRGHGRQVASDKERVCRLDTEQCPVGPLLKLLPALARKHCPGLGHLF